MRWRPYAGFVCIWRRFTDIPEAPIPILKVGHEVRTLGVLEMW